MGQRGEVRERRRVRRAYVAAPTLGQVLRRLAILAVLGGLVIVLVSSVPGLSEVRHRLAHARAGWVAATFCFELLSCLSFVAAFHGVTERRLPPLMSYHVAMTEQAANVLLPTGGAGGIALGALVLQRAGFDADRVAARQVALFLLTSAASFLALVLAGAALAAGLLGDDLPRVAGLGPAAAGAGGVLAVLAVPRAVRLRAEQPAGRVRGLAWRLARWLLTGIRESVLLIRRGDPELLLGCAGYLAFDIAALAAAYAAFGGGGPPASAFVVAYILGQLGALIPIPGGIGGTDGGLIGFFVLYGSSATAATAAFRVFQLGVPSVLGAIAFARLRGDVRALQARSAAGAS